MININDDKYKDIIIENKYDIMDGGVNNFAFQLQACNWNALHLNAKAITNPEMIDPKTLNATIGGLLDQSIVGKSTPYDDYYACECTDPTKALVGKINVGHLCPNCGTKVKKVENSNTKYGYIPLGNSYILNPLGFILLRTMLGSDPEKNSKHQSNFILDRIIDLPPINGKDGEVKREYSDKSKFRGIGLVKFREIFLKVIEEYKESIFRTPSNITRYNYIMEMYKKDILFVNQIYVSPINTRPVVPIYKEKQIKSHPITMAYDIINKLAALVRTTTDEESDFTTSRIRSMCDLQIKVYELGLLSVKTGIVGKTGIPRKHSLGGRMDNSARYVIVPIAASLPTLMNQIKIPYSAFVSMFSIQLAYYYIKRQGMFVNEYLISNLKAEIENSAYKFNSELYDITRTLIMDDNVKTMIGRNPTNMVGSIQSCEIVYVGWDPMDTTMGISVNTLIAMNADFDGDHEYEGKEITYNISAMVEGTRPEMLINSPQMKTFISGKTNDLFKDMVPGLTWSTQGIIPSVLHSEEREQYAFRQY